ncbi:MAG: DUF4337 domain-containing protein [Bacteroidota bacterium]
MAEEKEVKITWTNYLAISTVLIAVCATLSTFKGGSYSTRSLLNQTLAANQWSYFQSKSIKGYLFESQISELELQKMMLPANDNSKAALFDASIKSLHKKVDRYETEKVEIKKTAEKHEAIRDDCKIHSQEFGFAVIFLQVAILLSSIAALMKKKYIWYLSLAIGSIGIFYFANGFFLFF